MSAHKCVIQNVDVTVSEYAHRLARARTACTDPLAAELFKAMRRNSKQRAVFDICIYDIDEEEQLSEDFVLTRLCTILAPVERCVSLRCRLVW